MARVQVLEYLGDAVLLLLSVATVSRRYPLGSTDVLVPRAERCDAIRPMRSMGVQRCT